MSNLFWSTFAQHSDYTPARNAPLCPACGQRKPNTTLCYACFAELPDVLKDAVRYYEPGGLSAACVHLQNQWQCARQAQELARAEQGRALLRGWFAQLLQGMLTTRQADAAAPTIDVGRAPPSFVLSPAPALAATPAVSGSDRREGEGGQHGYAAFAQNVTEMTGEPADEWVEEARRARPQGTALLEEVEEEIERQRNALTRGSKQHAGVGPPADSAAFPNAAHGSGAPARNKGKGKGMSQEEANVKAREFFENNPTATLRAVAKGIGCAEGTVGKLPAWKAMNAQRERDRNRKAPRAVSLSPKVEARTGEKDPDLERLMGEQADDSRRDQRVMNRRA